jgi:choline dehydrogenase
LGNTGWGWADVLAAFRAMEDTQAGADAWRGTGGPLFISTGGQDVHPLVQPYLDACATVGLPTIADFNGPAQEGAGLYQFTIKGRRRNSAARAFLHPAMKRTNLQVLTGAQATRVLFDGTRAIGVEYRKNGQLHQAVGSTVILSAGAINTPQLLQLSGIGDGVALQSMGLQTLHHNPNVGAHLTDHQGINYTYRMNVPTYNDILRPWWGKLAVGVQWLLTGRGPLAKSINHAGGFFRTDPALVRPNMQLYMQAFSTLLPRHGERPIRFRACRSACRTVGPPAGGLFP